MLTSKKCRWKLSKKLIHRILGRNCNCYSGGFYSRPSSMSKIVLKLVCNVNIVFGNLTPENSQDYTQKPQRNRTSMNSTSVVLWALWLYFHADDSSTKKNLTGFNDVVEHRMLCTCKKVNSKIYNFTWPGPSRKISELAKLSIYSVDL
jgi:hypothetical protein